MNKEQVKNGETFKFDSFFFQKTRKAQSATVKHKCVH